MGLSFKGATREANVPVAHLDTSSTANAVPLPLKGKASVCLEMQEAKRLPYPMIYRGRCKGRLSRAVGMVLQI